jgi:hypothetical protein
MKKAVMIGLCLVVIGFSTLANAGSLAVPVVDTGAPGNTWGTIFVGGGGQDGEISQWLSGRFTLNQAYDIYEMQGYLNVNVQGDIRIAIYSDSIGGPADTPLFSNTFLSRDSGFYGWQGTIGYAGHLDPGTYWISFEAPDNSLFQGGMGMESLSSPVMDAEAYKANMGTGLGWSGWDVAAQNSGYGLGVYARIYGTPVPLPGAFWLLGTGIAGLAAVRKKYTAQA